MPAWLSGTRGAKSAVPACLSGTRGAKSVVPAWLGCAAQFTAWHCALRSLLLGRGRGVCVLRQHQYTNPVCVCTQAALFPTAAAAAAVAAASVLVTVTQAVSLCRSG